MGSALGSGAAQTAPAAGGGLTLTDIRRLWPEVVEAVKAKRRVTWIQLSQHAQVIGLDGRTLTIGFNNAGARESFVKGGSDVLVQQVLIDLVGQEWQVEAINDPAAQPGGSPDLVRKPAVASSPDARAGVRTAPAPDAARAADPPGSAPEARTSGGSGRPDSTRPGGKPDSAGGPGGPAGAAVTAEDQPPWSEDEPPPPDEDGPPPPSPRRGRPRPENFEAAAAEPKVDPATQDAAADRDDPTLNAQDTATLLSERLGAQVIEEIPHR